MLDLQFWSSFLKELHGSQRTGDESFLREPGMQTNANYIDNSMWSVIMKNKKGSPPKMT